jgi:hypothetical protein
MKAPDDCNLFPASTRFRDRAAKARFCPRVLRDHAGRKLQRVKKGCPTEWYILHQLRRRAAGHLRRGRIDQIGAGCRNRHLFRSRAQLQPDIELRRLRGFHGAFRDDACLLKPGAGTAMLYRPAGSYWREQTLRYS